MMVLLLAEIRTNQENMDVKLKEMKAGQKHLKEEMQADHHKELMVIMKASQEKIEAMVEVCLEKTELMDLEANPEIIESESEQQEVPKEEATVETIGALEDPYGNRHLAIGSHRQLKEQTQGDRGSRKKLTTSIRQMTRTT
jgi:hypothetical protein